VDATRPQRKTTTKKHLGKRSGEGNVDAGFGLAEGRWRWQHKTELDGDEWSVAYAPLGVTRHKSSQAITIVM